MRKSSTILLIIATVLVIAAVAIFLVAMGINGWDFKKLAADELKTNSYIIDENYSSINISAVDADVELLPSDDGKCRVVCYEKEKVMHEVKVESDTLIIEARDERKWYDYINPFSFDAPRIIVYLPSDMLCSLYVSSNTGNVTIPAYFIFESIDISATTGNVTCYSSASADIKIELNTGEIELAGLSAGSLNLKTSTGKTELKMIECSGDVTIETGTGKTKINALDCKNLYSTGNTGDIKLIAVTANGSFNIERSTGDIEFYNCDAGEIFAKTSTGDIEGNLLSDKIFIAHTSTGEIDVPRSTSGGICELTTSTGDIEIKVKRAD